MSGEGFRIPPPATSPMYLFVPYASIVVKKVTYEFVRPLVPSHCLLPPPNTYNYMPLPQHTHAQMYTHMYTNAHTLILKRVCTHARPHTFIQNHSQIKCTHTRTHTHAHIHMHTYHCTHKYTHTPLHTCTHTPLHTYTHTPLHTYTHTHTPLHTYVHTHTLLIRAQPYRCR